MTNAKRGSRYIANALKEKFKQRIRAQTYTREETKLAPIKGVIAGVRKTNG